MPNSTASFLEPLSSPSPSPPPPEEHNATSSNHSGPAGLDSGSELSELTEDEQEESRENGTKKTETRTSSRDSRRKSRGLVPAPMWDWAYKSNKKGDWRTRLVEEEEEEEQAGPATAMEEEEDDDQEQRGEADEEAADDDVPAIEFDGDDNDDAGVPVADDLTTPFVGALPALDETTDLMDVDDAVPTLPLVASNPVIPAGSSITAGSAVVQPPSPSSSGTSGSPSSSRSASPAPDADAPSDNEVEREPEPKATASRTSTRNKRRTRTRASRKRKADTRQDAENDADADLVHAADPGEGDGADAEDVEADSPELELELESDLQPAHRAEALDVLATIELKFAMLRERIYVEKMENLAWEEALVAEGTHPEMLHLHSELLKRRDKRLELAARRRDYEVANVTKRRKLDEDCTWSWWKTEMISETNRKRRKLERERRALERPQPERRIPEPPHIVGSPPTLREIVKAYPFSAASHAQISRHKGLGSSNTLVYPNLTTLSPTEVAHDLDFMVQNRRLAVGFDPHRQVMVNPTMGAPVGYDYPPSMPNMQLIDGPVQGNRFGPPPPAFSHQHPQHYSQIQGPQSMIQGFPGQGPRPSHHHSAPAGSLPNLHPSQMPMEPDTVHAHRPDSRSAHPGPHMQQAYGSGPSTSGPGPLMRRSISPVPVQTLSNGSGPSMPMGMGPAPMPPGFAGSKANGWVGVGQPGPGSIPAGMKEPRRPSSVAEGRERDRERERYMEGHPNGPGNLSNGGQGPTMSSLSTSSTAGPNSMGSPPTPRDLEPRRSHPSAEVIEMASDTSRQAGPSQHMWKSNDGLPLLDIRDRGKQPLGPPPVGPHERLMTPFGTPAQAGPSTFPGSPRNMHGPPVAPASTVSSRRGSFSIVEENGLPRPVSSSSQGHPPPSHPSGSAHLVPRTYALADSSKPTALERASTTAATASHLHGPFIIACSPDDSNKERSEYEAIRSHTSIAGTDEAVNHPSSVCQPACLRTARERCCGDISLDTAKQCLHVIIAKYCLRNAGFECPSQSRAPKGYTDLQNSTVSLRRNQKEADPATHGTSELP
ncbi:predicted protein [Postia placenta Mad-698-R]|uniref:Uncharacterized protein n=1 Tax=Postia placenta MAD-698-R-SB12 TaxID=670580 RepID=A0A1X6ML36_9APHY|nr:hypothetical protein POSPLADRAFT_1159026 [Postia placenta MAD-698-R-SB12]EED80278.1 predicted protein [Postia placenta Mad-698-R]OSX56773.1 hypothetical protein POSPLADRAFT_1159026 [Postia placenta MAD-698-R-SB12]